MGRLIMCRRKIIGKSILDVAYHYVDHIGEIPGNYQDNSDVSYAEFTLCRNLLVANLGQYGRVGAILEADPYPIDFIDSFGEISQDPDLIINNSDDYDIHILDDQLYADMRYQKVEIEENSPFMNTKILNAIWKALWSYPKWGVIIQNGEIYIYIELGAVYLNTRNDELVPLLKHDLRSLDQIYVNS